jgi:predicted hotdog family 3-hydroxylacyl-ACP dehydratase
MCLLDQVVDWDQQRIQCRASSHRVADNPLRAEGRLGAACGIEYAAQTMAVHGALLALPGSSDARRGYLVSARSIQFHVLRLDDIDADLLIEARCITRNENTVLYHFSISVAGRVLLDGRAAVVLDADLRTAKSGETS